MSQTKSYNKVHEEYIESLATWLLEWVEKPTSLVTTQFLKERCISWANLDNLIRQSPNLANIFGYVEACLHTKWLELAMNHDKLPPHQAKVLMKYLRVYDTHSWNKEIDAKKEVAREEVNTVHEFIRETYEGAELQGIYKQFFDSNLNKRRGRF